MADLQNELTWSKSRHEKLKECPRAYFLHYYGSWGGWDRAASAAVRELYVLKRLSSRWQWAGSIVHHAVKGLLERAKRGAGLRPVDELVSRTRERARSQWVASREKGYWRDPKDVLGLVEHEYGEPVADAEWKRLWDEVVEGSLRALYASEAFRRIQETPRDRWLSVDELDSFTFEGTKIWAAIDFAYRDDRGRVHVLDWKTGSQRDVDHVQLGVYALYAREKWQVPIAEVTAGLVYLQGGAAQVDVALDEPALEGCRDAMRTSIAEMKARLDDVPSNAASLASFPMPASRERCARCAFRRPCGRM
jgi:hypothetical protein